MKKPVFWCIPVFMMTCTYASEVPQRDYENAINSYHVGDYQQSIKFFTLHLSKFPNDQQALKNLAIAYFKNGNFKKLPSDQQQKSSESTPP